ncbi:PREDICTED: serpin-ZX-like [Erythranthe guttata]|uniref:serpin-ZX-like n=1 Tax=Erythranthe guttata TaxID=4155 RepID=UPI00064E09C7|nr:PREDICTED: serpin-ZX-like [Erythranthe guttata]|eukprot:XP_012830050.1 PREDICTED: serpin-ZX-like [Erythranthe guttata]
MVNSFSSKLVTHVLSEGGPLGGHSLSAANGVWVDQSHRFKPTFREIIHNSYKAAFNHVDFQSKRSEGGIDVKEDSTKLAICCRCSPSAFQGTMEGVKKLMKKQYNEELKKNLFYHYMDIYA